MNEIITYILYVLSFLALLHAYVKVQRYIKTLEKYIKLQDTEIFLLDLKAKMQDRLLELYREAAKNNEKVEAKQEEKQQCQVSGVQSVRI